MEHGACQNTDTTLYREGSHAVALTKDGALMLCFQGHCVVKTFEAWVRMGWSGEWNPKPIDPAPSGQSVSSGKEER